MVGGVVLKIYHTKQIVRFASDAGSTSSDNKSKFNSRFKVPSKLGVMRGSADHLWNLSFEAGKGPISEDEEFPPMQGLGSPSASDQSGGRSYVEGGYGGYSASGKSGKSSLTQQGTAPATTMTHNLEKLVKAAVESTTAQLTKEFQKLKAENQKIKEDFRSLQEMFST